MIISVKLTVLFNAPFWIGIFEIEEAEHYKVSKVTFGAEPKDAEVHVSLRLTWSGAME